MNILIYVYPYCTCFKSVFGFETTTLKFTTAKHHNKTRSVRHHMRRWLTLLPTQLIIKLVIGVSSLLPFQVNFKVTVTAAENNV